MLVGGVAHVIVPEFYAELTPSFINLNFANVASFIVEVLIGLMLIMPKYRKLGALAFSILMILFLPIHVMDYMRKHPVIGPEPIPSIRITFQFVLIYAGYWIYKKHQF